MSNIENASPAGESEGVAASTPLSFSAAADMLTRSEEREEQEEASGEREPEQPETPAEAEGEGKANAEEAEPGDPEGEPEEQPEDLPLDFDKLHGNTKLRLRDGSEVTVGEIKKRWGDLQDIGKARTEFETQERQFREWAGQIAQQAQTFEQLAPQALAAIQAQLPTIPEMPDISLRASDPFRYQEMMDDRSRAIETYNGKVAQMQAIEQQRQQFQQQQSVEAEREQAQFLHNQRESLYQAMPELRDEKKRQEFTADLTHFGTNVYGFSETELSQAYDHRLMLMARDAFAYRKLQAAKPKPAAPKPQTSVPVSQPGRRVTGGEARANRAEDLTSRIRKPGGLSISEGAALLDELEKG